MILIVGAGAIGTILATHLAAAGRSVGLYTRPKDMDRFSDISQLRVDFPGDRKPSLLGARPALIKTLDLQEITQLLIGVKYPNLSALLDQLPATIPKSCTLVSMLNGVAPLRLLRERLPDARIVPMSVMMNGQLLGPLHARLSTRAEIVIGSRDEQIVAPYRDIGIAVKTADGDAAVWGKLLINLANAVCALTRTDFRTLFVDRDLRRIYVAILDETTASLGAAGIAWKLPLIVPYPAYRAMLLHGGPLPWWFAKYRNGVRAGAYPSMVADVEAGRTTEVDQLNGEIVRLGLQRNIPTPVNTRITELIGSARTPQPMSPAELRHALQL